MDYKKDLYINNALLTQTSGDTLLKDIYIEHNSLPEIKFDEIDTRTKIFGKEISFPLLISPIAGGSELGYDINEKLHLLAKNFNLPLGIGSQQENLTDEDLSQLYIDRNNCYDNILISNLSYRASLEEIEIAMNKINAKAVSIYLNSTQEAVSYDRDKDFTKVIENIKNIADVHSKHLIVKEKGSGMSKKTVKTLFDCGVKYIDISGYGGTNIVEMENLKNYRNDFSYLYEWGVPTAKSVLNARSVSDELKIIASGGIKTGLDIVKALIIGADYVSVAGELLKHVLHGGYDQGKDYLENLIYSTKLVMFLLGVKNISELKKVEYKITGKLREIL